MYLGYRNKRDTVMGKLSLFSYCNSTALFVLLLIPLVMLGFLLQL